MRILFITLLLIACSGKDDSKKTDPEPKPTTSPSPKPTETPTSPQPSQTDFSLGVFSFSTENPKERLADTLQIAHYGTATVVASDQKRNGNRVKFQLSGCARPGVKLFLMSEIDENNGSFPAAVVSEVDKPHTFLVIDTSGSKDAVSGCVLQARVTNPSGGFDLVEKNITVQEGKIGISNPALTAAGKVSMTVETESEEIVWTGVFKVESEKYILAAAQDGSGPITANKFAIDTFVFDWEAGEENQEEEGELVVGKYLIVVMIGNKKEEDQGGDTIESAAMGGIAVSL